MSSKTKFWTSVTISQCTINSKEQLTELIKEKEDYKKYIFDRIRTMVFMTEPKKFIPEGECDDPEWYLNRRCDELFEELDETIYILQKLEMLYDCWDKCHDKETGLAIDLPDELDGKSYCGGDFVKTLKYPKGVDW